jgi:two-component system, probable response regulator PhcQ
MPRFMLVDDERNVLSSLRRTINAMPAGTFDGPVIIETFENPRLALARAEECEFDLVLSDWRMPGMNGITFLNELIQIQPQIARLVLSAYGDFLSELKAISRIRIYHFINKPWDSSDLRVLLLMALDHRQQLMAHQRPSDAELREATLLSEIELQRIDQEQPSLIRMKREILQHMDIAS